MLLVTLNFLGETMQEIYNEIKSTFDKILKIPMPLTFNDNKIECNGIVLESLIEKKGISPRDVKVYYVTTINWKYGSYDEPPFEDFIEICESQFSGKAIVEFITACVKLEVNGVFQARQDEHEEKLIKEFEEAEQRWALERNGK
jgi:hypothetical protein